jgi:hypothetical protein
VELIKAQASYLVFHKYEPQKPVPALSLFILVPGALSWSNARMSTPLTFFAYWLLLLLFTVVYRISPFHPLAKFPGPFLNKISKISMVRKMARGDLHRYHQGLFQKYGDIVRVGEHNYCPSPRHSDFGALGPNELSYNNVDGVESILNSLPKGPCVYSLFFRPSTTDTISTVYAYGESLVNIRELSRYPARRALWNKAFSSSSLKILEHKLIQRTNELMDGLTKHKSDLIDISKWMEFFAYVHQPSFRI